MENPNLTSSTPPQDLNLIQTSSATPPPAHNTKKLKIILIVFFIIFFITLGIASVIFFYKDSVKNTNKLTVPTRTITVSTDTSDWKTFTNEKFGFSLKYPADWMIREIQDQIIFSDAEIPRGRINLDVTSRKNLHNSALDEALNGKVMESPNIKSTEKVTIGEYTAIEHHFTGCYPASNNEDVDCLVVAFESNGNVFVFSPWIYSLRYDDLKTIYTMLSTFKSLGHGTNAPSTPATPETNCVAGGCSGQFCIEKSKAENFVSTCEYTASYACYKTAECKTQRDGKCGWTQTPELASCLESAQ